MSDFNDPNEARETLINVVEKLMSANEKLQAENAKLQAKIAEYEYPLRENNWVKVRQEVWDELQAAQRWIPVGERLPEKWGTHTTFLVAVDARYIKHSWYSREEGWDYSDVTHWMKLPEPPSTGEEG